MDAKPKLSIIIPCLNEEDYVDGVLGDLTRQQDFDSFEVIVVDSNSDDDTVAVAQTFSEELPVRTLALTQRGAARARNAGAKEAQSDYLLFLDADARLPKNFLHVLWQDREQHDADMMATHFRAQGLHPFDRSFYYWSSWFVEQRFKQGRPVMSGCVQFVRKSLHEAVGGFNENKTVGEDMDYSERIGKKATRPHFVPQLKIKVSSRRFKKDGRITMYLRNYQWVSGKALDLSDVDTFDFGHYHTASKKITLFAVLTHKRLLAAVTEASIFFIKEQMGKVFSKKEV